MIQCKMCAGFVPQSSSHCPNCSTRSHTKSKACSHIKTAATMVGAGMISMTLMACYGAPPDYPHQLPDGRTEPSANPEKEKEKHTQEKKDN